MYKDNQRIYAPESKTKVYHFKGCPCAKRIRPGHKQMGTRARLESNGFRQCKICGTMAFRWSREKEAVDAYASGHGITFSMEDDMLHINTSIGRWKIGLAKDGQKYALWHGNRQDNGWHRQADHATSGSIRECVQYIHKHDTWRRAQSEGWEIKVDKKYEKGIARKDARKKSRRIDSLFAKLESENSGYRELSYC